MSDTLKIFSLTYPDVTGIKVHDPNGNLLVYTRDNGGSSEPTLQSKTATPTESSQTITPDIGYDGLSSVEVGAISSTYVGSGISRKSSTDLTEEVVDSASGGLLITAPTGYYANDATKLVPYASFPITNSIGYSRGYIRISFDVPSAGYFPEAEDLLLDSIYITDIQGLPIITNEDITVSSDTVTVPSGWCNSSVSKTVASGTAGTPSASKGTVSNHSISVTPSVTNTTGYITGGTKTGTSVTVTASELASGNKAISSNGTNIDVVGYSTVSVDVQPSLQSKTGINPSTSSQTINPDSGYYGLSSVQINAMPAMTLPTSASSSSSGTSKATIGRSTSAQYINIPTGYNGTASYYTISATPNGSATTPATTITANPTITVSSSGLITATASASQNITPTVSAGYVSSGTAGTVTVSGSKTQQLTTQAAKTVAPTESEQTAVASGVYTTGIVKVGAISDTYVGSGIDQNDSDDLTVSGATITAPAGYYATSASKSVASGTAGTPSASKGTVSNHQISITPSVTNTTGYITGGTKTGTAVTVSASELVSGTLNVTSSGTKDVTNYASASIPAGTATAPSSISGTAATVSTGTNTLTLTKTVSVTPNVSTAGYISSGTAGNSSVSLTASVTTKAAATYNTSTTDQTIASGTYLTGTQTIRGVTVSGLDASKILSGTTVMVGDANDADRIASVSGTVTFSTITTSSSNPSGGNNGDVWIKTS